MSENVDAIAALSDFQKGCYVREKAFAQREANYHNEVYIVVVDKDGVLVSGPRGAQLEGDTYLFFAHPKGV